MKSPSSTLAVLALLLPLGACTRSMDYEYHPNSYAHAAASHARVGVAELEDKRVWVEKGDEKSKSFYSAAGSHRFGLTHKQKDYTPVGQILRDILVTELNAGGFEASAVEGSSSPRELAQQAHTDYIVTGDVQAFEVNADVGLVTVTIRKQININLNVYNAEGRLLDGPANFSQADSTDEGMGVMHSTNVDKLFNETLKPLMQRVVDRMQSKIALGPTEVKVTLNGRAYDMGYDLAGL